MALRTGTACPTIAGSLIRSQTEAANDARLSWFGIDRWFGTNEAIGLYGCSVNRSCIRVYSILDQHKPAPAKDAADMYMQLGLSEHQAVTGLQ